MRWHNDMGLSRRQESIRCVAVLLVASFLALCVFDGHAVQPPVPLKKIVFLPQWSPQAQFAGYYVALEKGIYRKYGLAVTIVPGGAEHVSSEYLTSGKADIVTNWLAKGIALRADGVRVVNIAQIIRRSALMLVAKKASGILKPEDLAGRRVGLWPGDFTLQPEAFFRKYGITVTVVPQAYTVNLFLRDGVDAASCMWYNEYHTILNAGFDPDELTAFSYADYGLNVPEDGLYMLEETYDRDPAAACAFARASIEGWLYAFAHPEEALDIVLAAMREARLPANRVHQRWMLARMKDLMLVGGGKGSPTAMGTLERDTYELAGSLLLRSGAIAEVPPYEAFYKHCAMEPDVPQ